ncbi:MAG: hypothetical protein R3F17_10075 [Planctomycetota bacterium]
MFGYLVVATGLQLPGVALSQGEYLSGAGGFSALAMRVNCSRSGEVRCRWIVAQRGGQFDHGSGYLVPDQTPWVRP